MMQVLLSRKSSTWDITEMVKSVDWSGKKLRAARSVRITFVALSEGQHQQIKMAEGEGIFFKWNGVELFRGIIFKTGRSKKGNFQLTAYDQLIYLLKNDASRVFLNQTASQMTRRLCNDFGVPVGSIVDTRYVIPSKVFDTKNLYDMILEALNDTHKNSKERFYVYSLKGKIHLIRRVDQTRLWVIEDGVNLIDYDYSTSIEDTSTRVVVEAGEDKKTVIATANNNDLQKRFGILQYHEKSTEKLNQAQAQQRANTILGRRGRVVVSFKVDALGIPDVISGRMIRVIEKDMGINRNYYVDYDSHTFEGRNHTMQLELTRSW